MFRYFRATTDAVYEQARTTLNAAWGYPSADGHTLTCFPLSSVALHDNQSRPYLQIRAEFCEYSPAVDLLPLLIAGGEVEEITEADWLGVAPKSSV